MLGGYAYTDIAIAVILLLCFISGIKKGLIDTVLGLIGGLVSFIAAILLAETVANFISPLFGIGDAINNSVNGFLVKLLNPTGDAGNQFAVAIGSVENIQALVSEAIGKLGLPATFTASISNSIATSINTAITNSAVAEIAEKSLIEILTPMLGHVVMLVISVILGFIAIRIVVAIIEAIAKAILNTSKALRDLNKFFGGLVGIVKGALVVLIIFTIGFFVLGGTEPNPESADLKTQVRTNIDQSIIGKYVYENNFVPKLITDNINFEQIINNLLGRDNNPDPSESSGA